MSINEIESDFPILKISSSFDKHYKNLTPLFNICYRNNKQFSKYKI